jgi:hypothetical protein
MSMVNLKLGYMKASKKYHGKWFLPVNGLNNAVRNVNIRFVGDLDFDPILGATLTLRVEGIFAPELKGEIQAILGETSHGLVTIYNCILIGHSIGKGSIYTYNVQFIIEGGHLPSLETMTYFKIHAELHNLSEWISKSGISVKYPDNPDEPSINIQFNEPEKIEFSIDELVNGYFRFFLRGPKISGFQKDAHIEQVVQVVFQQQNETSLKSILNTLNIFEDFLMLSLDKPTYPTSIILFSNRHLQVCGRRKTVRRLPLHLLAARPYRIENVTPMQSFKMLFNYDFLREQFPTIIAKWYETHRKIGSSFNLYFEQYYHMQNFNENTFLNLAQAAESYQAKMLNQTRMSEDDYNKIKIEILSVFNEDDYPQHYQLLKEQLSFGNEAKLHDRLTTLANRFGNTEIELQLGDISAFVKQVKWSRNYYTHYSDKLRVKALEGADLYFLTQKLRMLMTATILSDLGINKEVVAQQVAGHFRQL